MPSSLLDKCEFKKGYLESQSLDRMVSRTRQENPFHLRGDEAGWHPGQSSLQSRETSVRQLNQQEAFGHLVTGSFCKMLLVVPKRKGKLLFSNFRELAFSILRKAFSKREKHFQFFEKHSQNVRSIFNSSKSILKT